MTARSIIALGISLIFFGFGQSLDKPESNNSTDTGQKKAEPQTEAKFSTPDTSNQYIYEFMKVVIADRKLDVRYGLTIAPEQGCDLSQDDKTFLETLLIEKSNQKKHTEDWRNITINQLPKCLTREDIDEMLSQKEKLSDFAWDNSRLGFNLSNNKNWYCFSRPLFSVDRQKAVMMIRNLCPGLCGTGWTVVFTKQNNKWTSQSAVQWVH